MAAPTSADSAAASNGTKKKRYVRTQQGSARYRVPVGAEIGSARNKDAEGIQKDKGARDNYSALVGGDPKARQEALSKMSTADLDKLADIAFSFKSSNPQVVALRIAARNEQSKRGNKIKPGQTTSSGGSGYAAKQASINYSSTAPKAFTNNGPSERLVELVRARRKAAVNPDLSHLRAIVQNIDKAAPETKQAIAEHAVALAQTLGAEHVLSDRVIELTGKWKHGFIPVDAEAVRVKMKGGKGKQWWSAGGGRPKGSPKGSGGGGKQRTTVVNSGSPAKGAPVTHPKVSDAQTTQHYADMRADSKYGRMSLKQKDDYVTARGNGKSHSEAMSGVFSNEKGHFVAPATKRAPRPPTTLKEKDAAWAKKYPASAGKKLVDPNKLPKREGFNLITGKVEAGPAISITKAKSPYKAKVNAKRTPDRKSADDRLNSFQRTPTGMNEKPKPGAGQTPTGSHESPNVLAANYVKMHGDAGAKRKIAQLELLQKKGRLTGNGPDLLTALKAAVR
jgi:hypothetical protein